jgi:3-isopropylmalate/(R)-2-methylmalate dehydratase small subunit
MQKFTTLTGTAAPLPRINIDTDQIIPKQFLKTIERTGLAKGLFFDFRWDEKGKEKPDFVLNKPAYKKASILIAGENFGCGSSREHAPWALLDYGIRCVIATSFADIFYGNCLKNGLLPLKLPKAEVEKLMQDAIDNPSANARITVDLEKQQVTAADGRIIKFEIDPFAKKCLMEGLDDIGLTLQKEAKIASYEVQQKQRQPWLQR